MAQAAKRLIGYVLTNLMVHTAWVVVVVAAATAAAVLLSAGAALADGPGPLGLPIYGIAFLPVAVIVSLPIGAGAIVATGAVFRLRRRSSRTAAIVISAAVWMAAGGLLLASQPAPKDPVQVAYDLGLAGLVGAGYGGVMALPGRRRPRPVRALLVISLIAGFGSLALIPPAPAGMHEFDLAGDRRTLPLGVPVHPLTATFALQGNSLAAQISPDGRTLYVVYVTGACSSFAWATATQGEFSTLVVDVREAAHPLLAACPASAELRAAVIALASPLDPANPPAIVSDLGHSIALQPYMA